MSNANNEDRTTAVAISATKALMMSDMWPPLIRLANDAALGTSPNTTGSTSHTDNASSDIQTILGDDANKLDWTIGTLHKLVDRRKP